MAESPLVDIGTVPVEDVPAANRYIIRQQLQQFKWAKQQLMESKQKLIQAASGPEIEEAFGDRYQELKQHIKDL